VHNVDQQDTKSNPNPKLSRTQWQVFNKLYSYVSYVFREVHTRQYYCGIFITVHCHCHSATSIMYHFTNFIIVFVCACLNRHAEV